MDLPIQLKFFRKLELYQEYKSIKENISNEPTASQAWDIEKRILKWTTKKHWHFGSLLTGDGIKKDILNGEDPPRFTQAIENLVEKGYAIKDQTKEGIKITKEGLLMGEVANDLEGESIVKRYKYKVFFILIWLTMLSGIVIGTASAFKVLLSFVETAFCSIL